MSTKEMNTSKPSALKEAVRKNLVSLKRNPQSIPMAMLMAAFIYYSFNLTLMSNTTAKIQGMGMGLSQFCIMLFSLLSMVCLMNAFPRRKKANVPMVCLTYAMFAIIVYAEVHYRNAVAIALSKQEDVAAYIAKNPYVSSSSDMLGVHFVLMLVTAALIALLPVYSKLLRKIKTSVDVEDNGDMGAIEIDE